jgi:hypothetical protein
MRVAPCRMRCNMLVAPCRMRCNASFAHSLAAPMPAAAPAPRRRPPRPQCSARPAAPCPSWPWARTRRGRTPARTPARRSPPARRRAAARRPTARRCSACGTGARSRPAGVDLGHRCAGAHRECAHRPGHSGARSSVSRTHRRRQRARAPPHLHHVERRATAAPSSCAVFLLGFTSLHTHLYRISDRRDCSETSQRRVCSATYEAEASCTYGLLSTAMAPDRLTAALVCTKGVLLLDMHAGACTTPIPTAASRRRMRVAQSRRRRRQRPTSRCDSGRQSKARVFARLQGAGAPSWRGGGGFASSGARTLIRRPRGPWEGADAGMGEANRQGRAGAGMVASQCAG